MGTGGDTSALPLPLANSPRNAETANRQSSPEYQHCLLQDPQRSIQIPCTLSFGLDQAKKNILEPNCPTATTGIRFGRWGNARLIENIRHRWPAKPFRTRRPKAVEPGGNSAIRPISTFFISFSLPRSSPFCSHAGGGGFRFVVPMVCGATLQMGYRAPTDAIQETYRSRVGAAKT